MRGHTVAAALIAMIAMATLGTGSVSAANGDLITTLSRANHQYQVYRGLDAEADVTAAGTAIYLGAWDTLTFWPISGVDGGDTWQVQCGISGSADTEPTTWIIVQAETSDTTAKRMEPGDACEWVRVNKPTDTDDATTIWVEVVRLNR